MTMMILLHHHPMRGSARASFVACIYRNRLNFLPSITYNRNCQSLALAMTLNVCAE